MQSNYVEFYVFSINLLFYALFYFLFYIYIYKYRNYFFNICRINI